MKTITLFVLLTCSAYGLTVEQVVHYADQRGVALVEDPDCLASNQFCMAGGEIDLWTASIPRPTAADVISEAEAAAWYANRRASRPLIAPHGIQAGNYIYVADTNGHWFAIVPDETDGLALALRVSDSPLPDKAEIERRVVAGMQSLATTQDVIRVELRDLRTNLVSIIDRAQAVSITSSNVPDAGTRAVLRDLKATIIDALRAQQDQRRISAQEHREQ